MPFSVGHRDLFKYFKICKLIRDPWFATTEPTPQEEKQNHVMMLLPPCFTVFRHCALWLEFRTILNSLLQELFLYFSQCQLMSSLAHATSSAYAFLLVDRLASHRRPLTVTVLAGTSRPSLIILPSIIGSAIWHPGCSSIHVDGSLLFPATSLWLYSPF